MATQTQQTVIDRNELTTTRECIEAVFDLALASYLTDGEIDEGEAADLIEVLDGAELHIQRMREWVRRRSCGRPAGKGRVLNASRFLPNRPGLPCPEAAL